MSEEELKVRDKRMFTADGELREEFRHLEDPSSPSAGVEHEPAAEQPPSEPESEPAPAAASASAEAAGPAFAEPSGADEISGGARPSPGEVSILDLVGLLAEHTALYLGEASLPDGQSVRDLTAAKLHVDLLDVLRQKTKGNLTAEESSLLEDILYRLRMLYVERKREEG